MIREIVLYGDPVLRQKGRPVAEINEQVYQLAADMLDTMREANGVGLAAQQVGMPIQLTVIDVSDAESRPSRMWINGEEVDPKAHMPLQLLNPQVELGKETEVGPEGCLSFPEITADIVRAAHVKVRALDLEGTPVEFEAEGLLARAVQHETDHLNGILFIDRMNSATKAALGGRLKRLAASTK
ncbi:MAG: peptide deformylase [Verrucomicrobia bacterium]|nr:peptide deformylase [Verrucomicrobiota bacterium]